MSEEAERGPAGAVSYRIRVRGELDTGWSEWFAGLRVAADGGDTVLTGRMDQATVHAALRRIRDLGLPLISVCSTGEHMNAEDRTPRYLGAAFLVVVLTSLASGAATAAATGSGDIADVLVTVADHTTLLHAAVLAGLLNAVGILVLAAQLQAVLGRHGPVAAVTGVLCWTGESFFYALQQIASLALARTASDVHGPGGLNGPDAASYRSLGELLAVDVPRSAGTILMFFYCAGGLLFYRLFFTSRSVPRWLSGYGLVAVTVGIVGAGVELLGHRLGLLPYIAILPFEVVIGVYLLTRGVREDMDEPSRQRNRS